MTWTFVVQVMLSLALVCWCVSLVQRARGRDALASAVVGFVFLLGAAVAAYQAL